MSKSRTKTIAWCLPVALAAMFATMLTASTAHADDFSTSKLAVAAKIGGNWSVLSKPTDPLGQPTLLSGSAFDGMGFVGGVSAYYPLLRTHGAMLEVEAGLMFSHHSTSGYEKATSGEERTVTLTSTMLRIPVMVHLKSGNDGSGFRLGVGLEPMFGMASGATVQMKHTTAKAEPLQTTPTTHLGTTIALGFDYQARPKFIVPLEFRATWDPFVGSSTRDRFENFKSMSNPGNYQVAYNWQFLLMTGLRYEL